MNLKKGIECGTVCLPREGVSETVLRKALYWLTEACEWELEEGQGHWQVTLRGGQDGPNSCRAEFDRLLNDFLLRERLDQKTGHLREQITLAALKGLVRDDTGC